MHSAAHGQVRGAIATGSDRIGSSAVHRMGWLLAESRGGESADDATPEIRLIIGGEKDSASGKRPPRMTMIPRRWRCDDVTAPAKHHRAQISHRPVSLSLSYL